VKYGGSVVDHLYSRSRDVSCRRRTRNAFQDSELKPKNITVVSKSEMGSP